VSLLPVQLGLVAFPPC
jgi:hypothetical protein